MKIVIQMQERWEVKITYLRREVKIKLCLYVCLVYMVMEYVFSVYGNGICGYCIW
jgi:hypothetical protein